MRNRTNWIHLVACLGTLGLALGASADLTGTWEGKTKCKGLDEFGQKSSEGDVSQLQITQQGADLALEIDGLRFSGMALDADGYPGERGLAPFEGCDNDGDPTAIEMMGLGIYKADAESGKGAVKIQLVSAEEGAQICKGSYKRVDVADPGVPACDIYYSCVCTDVDCSIGGGAAGVDGELVSDVSEANRTANYENGNDNGWVCAAQ